MKNKFTLLAASLLFAISYLPAAYSAVNYQDVDRALKSEAGLVAEVHGADKDSGLFVVVIRKEENFFDYVQVPMVADYTSPNYQEVFQKLYTLNRHDLIRIKGGLHGWLEAAQRHILVSSLEIEKKFDGGYENYPGYKHLAELPKDLETKDSAVVKVHAVVSGGKILMVEYKDTNVPVVVEDTTLVRNLYRGDKIQIKYSIAKHPKRPTHLNLKSDPEAVVMITSVLEEHNKPIEHCGEVIMFPKSPMVRFNVFALKKDLGDDLFWTYTLINFEDMDLFTAIREKAQAMWDKNLSTVTRGRNYYVNTSLIGCARGTGNMVDPSQANPQIIINKIEDLYFP